MICDDIKHLIYSYVYKSQYRDVLNELINCCRLVNNDLRSAVETYTLIISNQGHSSTAQPNQAPKIISKPCCWHRLICNWPDWQVIFVFNPGHIEF